MNTKALFLTLSFLFIPFQPEAEAKKSASTAMVNQVSRTRFEVSRNAVERDIKDPEAQLGTFRAMPSGFFNGIKVSHFKKNCLLPRFGIQSGDVVEMVNGQPIRTPLDVMEIGQSLAKAKAGTKVRVALKRGDQDLTHTYLLVE
jgi:S1-C subfamily serine protease